MLKQKRIMYSILIFLIVGVSNLFGQERVLKHLDGNLYSYRMYDGKKVTQSGYYKSINGTLIVHGIWRDNFGTTALFENGNMVWIKPKGRKKYTQEQIQLHRLRKRVAMLEQKITSL